MFTQLSVWVHTTIKHAEDDSVTTKVWRGFRVDSKEQGILLAELLTRNYNADEDTVRFEPIEIVQWQEMDQYNVGPAETLHTFN